MGKYLKEFELTSQYEEYINSTMALLPNVSLTNDDNMVHYNPKVPNYLKFTAEEDNSTISLTSANSPDIKYSLNGGDWTQWDYSAITLNTGDTVRMKGNNSNFGSYRNSAKFKMTGKIGASGNIMSLLYEDDFEGKLTIPSNECYAYMFEGCSSLTTAPELPATRLSERCYYSMFSGCTSLTTAPDLPATTLANYCYAGMFLGCTSLTAAPELPATTLARSCYSGMYNGCTNINYIKMLATDVSTPRCLNNWVDGVASTGTFIKHPDMTSLPTGVSGIPEGWTVQDVA